MQEVMLLTADLQIQNQTLKGLIVWIKILNSCDTCYDEKALEENK